MNLETNVFLRIANLAHQNQMTLEEFTKHIESQYKVRIEHLPKDEHNCTMYPSGEVGIDLDMTDEEAVTLHLAAAKEEISTNEFILRAVTAAAEREIAKHESA